MIATILNYIPIVGNVTLGLCILATILTRLIPGDKDNVLADSFANKLLKVLSVLPTFGINPRTKTLEEALKAMQAEKSEGQK